MKSAGGATLTQAGRRQHSSSAARTRRPKRSRSSSRPSRRSIKSLRLEALAHPSLVKGGPGRATNGNFALSDLRVTVAAAKDKEAAPDAVKLTNPRATFEQKGLPVAAAIDDDPKTAWAIDPQFGKDHAAAFDFEKPVGFAGGTVLTVTLAFNNNTGHGIGRPRISLSAAEKPDLTGRAGHRGDRASALATPAEKRTPEQAAAVLKWFAPQDAECQKLRKAERDHAAKAPKPNKVKALISSEGLPAVRLHTQGADFLKETHFLRRGDPGAEGRRSRTCRSCKC